MNVVTAARLDLENAGADAKVLTAIDKIIKNEAEFTVTVTDGASGKSRTARRSGGQEAVRAEVEKDARALVDLTGAHAALKARQVDVARLNKLAASAQALHGKLSSRAARKGAAVDLWRSQHSGRSQHFSGSPPHKPRAIADKIDYVNQACRRVADRT
jgi:hypothetical protein